MSKAKLTTLQEAQPSIEKFKARTLSEGEVYAESFFFDIESIKELIQGVPTKNITGVRVHLAHVEREEGFALSPVVEVVTKGVAAKGVSAKVLENPPACPIFCG